MELEEISEYEKQLLDPNTPPNIAQTRLAQEITRFVHGEENLKKALSITQNVKPGSLTSLDIETLENLEKEIPSITLEADLLLKTSIIDLLNYVKLTSSKGESRRLIKNGGVYLNNQKILDAQKTITNEDLIKNKILLLGVGKKKKMIIRLKGS